MSNPLFWVQANRLAEEFPDTNEALIEPDGLLAAGGDLSPERLIYAYRNGIFPWFSTGQPILWWAPDPRAVLFPERVHVSRSLRRKLNQQIYQLTTDRDFAGVMQGCAAPRREQAGTWITDDMFTAYGALHRAGFAHSIECWRDGELVGGIYGVAIGCAFYGESMFSAATDASKCAMVGLAARLLAWGYEVIDCQIQNPHLVSLGAESIPRKQFNAILKRACAQEPAANAWTNAVVTNGD